MSPENGISSRLVTPKNPLTVAMTLAQYLMFLGPEGSEWSWRSVAIIEADEPGKWFAIRSRNSMGYQMAGTKGRFSRTAPEGVDVATMPILDESGSAPTALREYMDALAESIAAAQPEYAEKMKAIAAATWRGDNLGWLRGELAELSIDYARKGPEVTDAAWAEGLETETRRRYLNFEIPGALASAIFMLTRIAKVAAPERLLHAATLLGGKLDIFDGPQTYLRDRLAQIGKVEGGSAKIAEAAATLQDEAEVFGHRADAAKGFGEFYGSIFESVPLAYAAQQGFEFLALSQCEAVQPKAGKYQVLANVCEELIAPAFATLRLAFEDAMDWRELHWHRERIAAERKAAGDEAAGRLTKQYTRAMQLYPIFLEDFLMGKTDELRLTAAAG